MWIKKSKFSHIIILFETKLDFFFSFVDNDVFFELRPHVDLFSLITEQSLKHLVDRNFHSFQHWFLEFSWKKILIFENFYF